MKKAEERYKQSGNVSWRRVGDEIVILDLETSAYFSLNETSAFIWERLVAGFSAEEAAEALVRQYGAKPDEAKKHVKAQIQNLLKAKALTPWTGKGPSDKDLAALEPKGGKKKSYLAPVMLALGLLSTPPHEAFGTGDL